ncbi:MAG: hypothetical protein WC307_04975 [Candidatus Nanoarchaeia archaeon]|jgi:hypothetical protein
MAENVGKLEVEFAADINDFRVAIQEVKSLMKDMSSETRKSTGDFAVLAGVTAGVVNFGLGALKDTIQGVTSGIKEYLSNNAEFVLAQSDVDKTFREMATDVGPGATNALEGFNEMLKTMGPEIELINGLLYLLGNALKYVAEQKKSAFENLGLPTTDEITAENISGGAGAETRTEIDPETGEKKIYANEGTSWGWVDSFYEGLKRAFTDSLTESVPTLKEYMELLK